jgi:hypothetical protein
MKIVNRHQREYSVGPVEIGALIDALASKDDRLWPHFRWPRMHFDTPLGIGANGGHGPIGYFVENYAPARSIVFRFQNAHLVSRGIEGVHSFFIEPFTNGTRLVHLIDGEARGRQHLLWPLLIRPTHDALIEDSFDCAALALGLASEYPRKLSPWVRFLRALLRRLARKALVKRGSGVELAI